jgi:hypothetical protein
MSPRSSTTPTTDQPSSGSRSTSRIRVADHLEPDCTWTAIRGGAAVADEYRHYWIGAAKRPLGPINVGRPGQGLENGLGVCLQQRRLGRYRGTNPKRRPSFPLDALVVCRVVRPVAEANASVVRPSCTFVTKPCPVIAHGTRTVRW